MTEQQYQMAYEAMATEFGEHLPSYEHQPIEFAYYVKMFKYYRNDLWTMIMAQKS